MMGKKFKLSDMIPNAWFYKLKYMNKPLRRNSQPINPSMLDKQQILSPPPSPSPPPPEPECGSRKSYHITRELSLDHLVKSPPSRKSKSRRSTRRSSSISSFSCQSSSTSLSFGSKSRSPPSPPPQQETDVADDNNNNVGFLVQDCLVKVKQTILDSNAGNAPAGNSKPEHFDSIVKTTHFQLSPIITKKTTKEEKQKPQNSPPSRRKVRVKINSPRFLAKKQGQNGHNKNVARKSTSSRNRRSISESFAIVKSSFDPQKDFQESMVEMIVQNNLTATKDLEDLLACYLSLNSDEYHDIIIKVFKQIWFDFRHR